MSDRAAWLAFVALGAACGSPAPRAASPEPTIEATSAEGPDDAMPSDEATSGALDCGLEYDVAFDDDGRLLPTPRGTMTVTPANLASGSASVVMAFEEGQCETRRFPPGRYRVTIRVEGSEVVARFHVSVCANRETYIEAAVSRAEGGILYESDELPCGPSDEAGSERTDEEDDEDW